MYVPVLNMTYIDIIKFSNIKKELKQKPFSILSKKFHAKITDFTVYIFTFHM